MTIHPSITFEQHQSVLTTIRQRQKLPAPNQTLGVLMGAAIGVAFALLIVNQATRVAGICLLSASAICWFLYQNSHKGRLALLHRISFDQMQPVLNGNAMTIDPSGIRGTWVQGKANYDFTWSAFEDLVERSGDLLFLYAPCCYIRVSKQELDAAEITRADYLLM